MLMTTNPYRVQQFWLVQLMFWVGLSIVTFFTLTLWYEQVSLPYISHTLMQGVLGLILSTPLHLVFSRIWNIPPFTRFTIVLLAVALVAGIWTWLRMVSFIWITKQSVWADFGGWYFGALFVFLCWAGLYHGMRYYQLLQSEHLLMVGSESARREEQVQRLLAESDARDAQLKMLRYQLNPHFLFNTLNAINCLVRVNKGDQAQRMIVQLSQFLRYSLDNDPDTKISLHREVDALMLYLEIEKTRFGERLKLDFVIDEDARLALIPSLLLQPLIENSMKYAIAKNEDGGTIRLHCMLVEKGLALELSDSGCANKLDKRKIKCVSGRGIGLRNTADRLKALYGNNYDFDLSINSSGGLKTLIRIPFETDDFAAEAMRNSN